MSLLQRIDDVFPLWKDLGQRVLDRVISLRDTEKREDLKATVMTYCGRLERRLATLPDAPVGGGKGKAKPPVRRAAAPAAAPGAAATPQTAAPPAAAASDAADSKKRRRRDDDLEPGETRCDARVLASLEFCATVGWAA